MILGTEILVTVKNRCLGYAQNLSRNTKLECDLFPYGSFSVSFFHGQETSLVVLGMECIYYGAKGGSLDSLELVVCLRL